jgi:hypothetical protein
MGLKTCKKHGDLTIDNLIKSGISYGKQRYKCKLCMKDFHKKNYINNKDKILEKIARNRNANKEKYNAIRSKSWQKHKDKYLERDNKRRAKYKLLNPDIYQEAEKKRISELHDSYIRKQLTKRGVLFSKDIPQSLVELKRILLKTKRLIKEKKQAKELKELKDKTDEIEKHRRR